MLLNKEQSIINDELASSGSTDKNKNIIKYLVIIITSIVLLALIIILIILLTKSKTHNDNNNNNNNKKYIGEINCIFYAEKFEEIKILGNEFIKDTEFDIFIDDKKIEFTKKYKFDKIKN